MTDKERVQAAIELGLDYAGCDGGHHKMWVIDQMLKVLLGDKYHEEIKKWEDGEDGPKTYTWDCGIAP